MTTTVNPRRAWVNFSIFTLFTLGAGWLGVAVDLANGVDLTNGIALSNSSGTNGQALFILLPVLAAVALHYLSRDGAGPLGMTFRFGHKLRWFGGALALYPAITFVAVGSGVLVGAAHFSSAPATGKPPFLTAFLVIFVIQIVKNLAEEFIFRGYGTRTAMALGLRGSVTPHLLVGVVWALWHLPLYLMWTSEADLALLTSLPWGAFLPLLVIGVVATAVVYGQMRVRTGSIWPGILLHTMCNAVATPLLANGHLTFVGHGDMFFSPVPSSIVAMVLFAVVGLVLTRMLPRPTDQSTVDDNRRPSTTGRTPVADRA